MGWELIAADAVAAVECGGERHHVRAAAGELVLDDHDLEAEEALLALGGEPPRCVEVVRLWREAVADGGFLEEWAAARPDRQRRAWLRTALRRLRAEGVQDLLPGLPPRRAERMGRVLVELPPALLDRAAVVAAARALEPDVGPGALGAHVARAVEVRARRAFVDSLATWRAYAPVAPLVPFRCRARPGRARVGGRLAGRASRCELDLDPSWLVDVWGAGCAVAGGHLVVAAHHHGTGGDAGRPVELDVVALRWEPGPTAALVARLAPATLQRDDAASPWRLRWPPRSAAPRITPKE